MTTLLPKVSIFSRDLNNSSPSSLDSRIGINTKREFLLTIFSFHVTEEGQDKTFDSSRRECDLLNANINYAERPIIYILIIRFI